MTVNKLKVKKAIGTTLIYIFRYAFFISVSYIILYPFLYILINAIKSFSDAHDVTVTWVPKTVYFGNLRDALLVFDVKNTAMRSFVYEVVAGLIQFCSCSVAAYGLARFKLKGRGLLFGMMILNILVPSMMIITPSFVNFSNLDIFGILGGISKLIGVDIRPNLIGTPLVFYLPALLGVGIKGGLFIYIYMQFFKGLPKELEEAAWIDGAGAWKTFLRIVVPSSGSATITVLLFSVVWHWNDYYLAQMYMNEQTFPVAVNNFSYLSVISALGLKLEEANALSVPILLAGCFLLVLPMIIFYVIVQRKFMASIATSGIVG